MFLGFQTTEISDQVTKLRKYPKCGYESDYYFKAIDRINPYNGYVVNTESFPVRTSGNLGISGPFVQLSLVNFGCQQTDDTPCCIPHFDDVFCGIYGEITGAWLKPVSNNDDLVYATLTKQDGSVENQQVGFNNSWSGLYKIGYRCPNDLDFSVSYFYLDDSDFTSVTAGADESLLSVSASGPAFVEFSSAQSQVYYDLDQLDFIAGKCFSAFCGSSLLLSTGLRYARIERKMKNEYEGGAPPETTESKISHLQSNFNGLGPMFKMESTYAFCRNLRLSSHFSTAFLIGHLGSKLDQINEGNIGSSSNTLRTPWARSFVPVVDVGAGLSYQCKLSCGATFSIEAGYQFTDYFRAINLVYPTLLTGLEQVNSDLKLHGPYLTLRLANF